jgi:hypothetical protein
MFTGIMHFSLPRNRSLTSIPCRNTVTQVIRRWVFMIARLCPNYETNALVLHSTDRPADSLVFIRCLDSDQLDMPRRAIVVSYATLLGLEIN